MPEIDLNPEIICEIIAKSREFQAKEEVVIPEDDTEFSEEDTLQILADHQNDLTYLEVKTAISNLEPDQRITLIAVMFLGRGDFSLEEWDECLEAAAEVSPKQTANYLLSKPHIADFLEEGLSLLGYDCED